MKTKKLSTFITATLLGILLAGCSQEENLPAKGQVMLFTRATAPGTPGAAAVTGNYRILAFDTDGTCAANEPFTPGAGKLSLTTPGTYTLVTLGNADASALTIPTGTTGALSSAVVSYTPGQSLPSLYYSKTDGFDPSTGTYTAQLAPAVGGLRLVVAGHKAGYSYSLTNMHPSVKLSDGSATGDVVSLPLASGQTTACFPTDGNIQVECAFGGAANETTLDAGVALEKGKVTTLYLKVDNGEVTLTASEISAWDTQGEIADEIETGPGIIDMTAMDAAGVKAAIDAAIAAGFTEFKLTGPIANLGIKEDYTQSTSNPFYDTGVTKVDLSGVTGWQTVAYSNFPDVTSSVAGLPAYTFYRCTALTEVVLPAEVKAIGAGAFTNCTSLSTINLKDVTHIGKQAFGFCEALTAVDLSAVINLYMEAFQETGLTALYLPEALAISDGLTANNLGSHTGSFGDCESLVSVNAPKLTSTGYKSFSGCSALTALTLPALTEINDQAFYSCKKLTTENEGFGFAKEVTTVGEDAFGYCTGLTNPELPKATLINSRAFTGCTAMESLKLPEATKFGNYIVSRCKSLTRIEVTASGAFTDDSGVSSLDVMVVFGNQGTTSDPFDAANCALVLNADKKSDGGGSPTVNGLSWANTTWKEITYPDQAP